MKPRRISRPGSVLALGLLALLALASALVFAGHETTVASFTGCLNLNGGTLVSLAVGETPLTPCGQNQMKVHLSGGDITAVTAGTGLLGGSTNGSAPLSVHPDYRLPQACATGGVPKWNGSAWACGVDIDTDTEPLAFGGFAEVGGTTESVANDPDVESGVIGRLALPAGKYAIFAKVSIHFDELDAEIEQVACSLQAGDDFDHGSRSSLEAGNNTRGVISLMLLHDFAEDGVAEVTCFDFGHDEFLDQADAIWSDLRMTAIKLRLFSNGTLPR